MAAMLAALLCGALGGILALRLCVEYALFEGGA